MTTRDQMYSVVNAPPQSDRVLSFEEISPKQATLIVVQGQIDELVVEALRASVGRIARYHGYEEKEKSSS